MIARRATPPHDFGPLATPRRLTAALGLSLGLHLWLMYGVSVVPPRPDAASSPILARLDAQPEPAARFEADATPRTLSPSARGVRLPPATPADAPRPELQDASAVPPAPPTGLPPVEMPLLTDLTWYPARQLDVYPRPVSLIQPHYPEQAAAEGVHGSVTLLIHIDENGLARELEVVEVEPPDYAFEAAAMEAYRAARWVPAVKDARQVRSRVLVRVNFDPGAGAKAPDND